ncbi:MAG: TIGR02757 family protein [Deltaproteobacteria bacterium]|nr:TIGR02757 family protein [Deltaproteobacteria bacterium]
MAKSQARRCPIKKDKTHQWLDDVLLEFNSKDFLKTDPISIVHTYARDEDREFAAFITALFAFGNVKCIVQISKAILDPLGKNPVRAFKTLTSVQLKKTYSHLYYRFYTSADILFFLQRLQDFLNTHSSLGQFFEKNWNQDICKGITALRVFFVGSEAPTRGLRFMFADPYQSSAKRWHMMLRWLVRKDEIDLGLWSFVPKSALILPLDTHLFDISKRLGLTQLKSASRTAALEITEKFKVWSPEDPIKYDFALCRLGILKLKNQRLVIKAS